MVAEKDVGSRELEKDKITVTLSVWVSNQSFQKKIMVSIPFSTNKMVSGPLPPPSRIQSCKAILRNRPNGSIYQIWMDVQMAYLPSGKLT